MFNTTYLITSLKNSCSIATNNTVTRHHIENLPCTWGCGNGPHQVDRTICLLPWDRSLPTRAVCCMLQRLLLCTTWLDMQRWLVTYTALSWYTPLPSWLLRAPQRVLRLIARVQLPRTHTITWKLYSSNIITLYRIIIQLSKRIVCFHNMWLGNLGLASNNL